MFFFYIKKRSAICSLSHQNNTNLPNNTKSVKLSLFLRLIVKPTGKPVYSQFIAFSSFLSDFHTFDIFSSPEWNYSQYKARNNQTNRESRIFYH